MAKLTRKQINEGLDQIPLDSLLLGARTESRLTPKQREFARKVANGTGQTQAYRETYNSKGKKATSRVHAYQLTKNERVATTIEAFRVAKEFQEQHTAAQLRALVIQKLTEHATSEDNSPRDQLQALKLLGTVAEVGAFVHQTASVNVTASADIRARLMEKLKLIGASVSDGVVVEKPEESADSLLEELHVTPESGDITAPEAETDNTPTVDPTLVAPPSHGDDTLIDNTHSIPLTRSQVPLKQSPPILTGTISSDNTDSLSNQVVTDEETLHEPYKVGSGTFSKSSADVVDGEFTDTPVCLSETK